VILHGDCRQQLATLEDCSVDSIVTDPPYELGFMGKKWDASGIAYDSTVWTECLRVLKPGGHLLAFGGTRTYHRMTCAIEDAGFEIRDSLHWLYGSGFPKSLDVSKAIDKAAGIEGSYGAPKSAAHAGWIERGAMRGDEGNEGWQRPCLQDPEAVDRYARQYKPADEHAQRWQGWGTALKPAHEPIVLARKPLVGTVAANVMAYGTGALNIDGCRIGAPDGVPRFIQKGEPSQHALGDGLNGSQRTGTMDTTTGRWPANLILTHSPDCQQTGTTTDTFTVVAGFRDYAQNSNFGARTQVTQKPQSVEVATWDCVAGCPVAALNAQSGNRPGGTFPTQRGSGVATGFGPGLPTEGGRRAMGDSGGASRFFTTTEWDPELDVPFLYVAKPSRRERNAGLDGMPEGPRVHMGSGGRTLKDGQWVETHSEPQPRANFHPTVKPVALMRHLVRLVTPPGGTVLDPFLGSGTTAVAATLEGFAWIGCELTDDYLPIIEARTAWAEQNRPEPELTLFTEQP